MYTNPLDSLSEVYTICMTMMTANNKIQHKKSYNDNNFHVKAYKKDSDEFVCI